MLQQRPLSDFVEAVPASFSPENRYDQVIRLFDEQVMEFACVRDEHGGLQSIVSKNELFQALEQGRGPATTVRGVHAPRASDGHAGPDASCRRRINA